MRLLIALLFISFHSISFAQLTVRNNAYLYVKDQVLFVEDAVNLSETNSKIYLRDASQLVQGSGANGNSGIGELSVYQNGNVNQWSYNYWCAPVGGILSNTTTNNPFRINQTDDPLLATLSTIDSQNALFTNAFEGTPSPLTISRRWLWTYVASNAYADWVFAGDTGDIPSGLGFTMKGMGAGLVGNQTYDFRGKPNNGTITNTVAEGFFTLVGNPYPSAIDAALYIHDLDNTTAIDGTLYYWEQDGTVNSHVLQDYIGGYYEFTINAAGNMITDTPAVFKTYDENDNVFPLVIPQNGIKMAGRYIPIGQGFMVKGGIGSSGTVFTKNAHRVYEKEGPDSYFFRNSSNNTNEERTATTEGIIYQDNGLSIVPEDYMRFRLNIDFTVNESTYTRQLVLNFHETATSGFDRGLELSRSENYPSDAYFTLENSTYSGQAYAFSDTLSIPIIVDIEAEQPLRFRLFDVQNFEPSQGIYIHDIITGTYVNLRHQDYDLNIAPGNYTNRFEIVFTSGNLLNIGANEVGNLLINQDNPNHLLSVLNPANTNIKTITVYDISGKRVLNSTYNTVLNRYTMSTKNLSTGVYIVNINTSLEATKSQKIIIKN